MKRALLIASSTFLPDSGIEPLRFPLNDVEALERVLTADDFGFEVEKLINPTSSIALDKLGRWAAKAAYDDLVLIYFSGHGKLSRTRELFLACANTESAHLIATSLKYTVVTDLIQDKSLQKVVVILDCCYAARALPGVRGDVRGTQDEQVRAAVDPGGSGIFFLGASGRNQTAEEREIDGHGRLTKQILVGLTSGDADIGKDGDITAKELATYVKQRLREEYADQEPIEGGAYQGEIVLGANRRKILAANLVQIRSRVEMDKKNFRKETFRAIEDYLDEIEKDMSNLTVVFGDRKYSVLKSYAANVATSEDVAHEFWSASGLGMDEARSAANGVTQGLQTGITRPLNRNIGKGTRLMPLRPTAIALMAALLATPVPLLFWIQGLFPSQAPYLAPTLTLISALCGLGAGILYLRVGPHVATGLSFLVAFVAASVAYRLSDIANDFQHGVLFYLFFLILPIATIYLLLLASTWWTNARMDDRVLTIFNRLSKKVQAGPPVVDAKRSGHREKNRVFPWVVSIQFSRYYVPVLISSLIFLGMLFGGADVIYNRFFKPIFCRVFDPIVWRC